MDPGRLLWVPDPESNNSRGCGADSAVWYRERADPSLGRYATNPRCVALATDTRSKVPDPPSASKCWGGMGHRSVLTR